MKITLDHNCIIHLENATAIGDAVRSIVGKTAHECFVVNIGASEMRARGVRPDTYTRFEELLVETGLAHLPRLNPMMIFDVTFWDHCVFGEEDTIELAKDIDDALFGRVDRIDIAAVGLDSPEGGSG
jgi:hypothetical protein